MRSILENLALGYYHSCHSTDTIQIKMAVHSVVTHMFGRVHVGQAVQAEDVTLLPVLVDLGECLFCEANCFWVLTRTLFHAAPLHWCAADVHATQRQQQRQQQTMFHGGGKG